MHAGDLVLKNWFFFGSFSLGELDTGAFGTGDVVCLFLEIGYQPLLGTLVFFHVDCLFSLIRLSFLLLLFWRVRLDT